MWVHGCHRWLLKKLILMRRSLERLMSWAEVPFAPSVDSSEPEPEELGRVEKILAEADEEEYWFAASKDGNRISHYRGLHNYTDLLRESQPGHLLRTSPHQMHHCTSLFSWSCSAR